MHDLAEPLKPESILKNYGPKKYKYSTTFHIFNFPNMVQVSLMSNFQVDVVVLYVVSLCCIGLFKDAIVNPILNSGCSPTSVPPNVICLAPQNRVTVTLPLTLPPTYKYHTSPDHIHPADITW